MEYRIEKDILGEVKIEKDRLWGAQTQRSLENFQIGKDQMPLELIYSIVLVKKTAAIANYECGVLSYEKKELIVQCCDLILSGQYDDSFPLSVWQTGSGTQTNMNINEVISNLSFKINPEANRLSPNDDVNKSQSTNDVFPTAMRVASVVKIVSHLFPAIQKLESALKMKSEQFKKIQKIGRTHLMDATPLSLGDEFSAFASQVFHCFEVIRFSLNHLLELPIGGTAVGNGINTPEKYDQNVVKFIHKETGIPFQVASNKFEGMASHDSFVECSSALK